MRKNLQGVKNDSSADSLVDEKSGVNPTLQTSINETIFDIELPITTQEGDPNGIGSDTQKGEVETVKRSRLHPDTKGNLDPLTVESLQQMPKIRPLTQTKNDLLESDLSEIQKKRVHQETQEADTGLIASIFAIGTGLLMWAFTIVRVR